MGANESTVAGNPHERPDLRLVLLVVGGFTVGLASSRSVGVWWAAFAASLSAFGLFALLPAVRMPFEREPTDSRLVLRGVIAGVFMVAICWAGRSLFWLLPPFFLDELVALYDLIRQSPGPAKGLPILLVTACVEEFVFRGLVLSAMLSRYRPLIAVIAASVVSVLPQLAFSSPMLIMVVFACGLVFGTMRVLSGSLLMPLGAHVVFSVSLFVLIPLV